jgi:hypothetical protein
VRFRVSRLILALAWALPGATPSALTSWCAEEAGLLASETDDAAALFAGTRTSELLASQPSHQSPTDVLLPVADTHAAATHSAASCTPPKPADRSLALFVLARPREPRAPPAPRC